jgi:hypothetical protein
MSGQFSASLSFDKLPERISASPTLAPRSARPPVDSLGISDTGTDGRALEAVPAPVSRRRDDGLGPQVGILLHLACIAVVGTAIVVAFFGIAFSGLGHSTEGLTVNSGARDLEMPLAGAELEKLQSARTLSAVAPRSAPAPLADEAPSSAAAVAPSRDGLPAAATAPGTAPVMAAVAAVEPDSTQLPTIGTQPDQRLPPNPIAETTVVSSQQQITGPSGEHSGLKQSGNATPEIVRGMVTDTVDAMTWVVGDQTVNLWGIRPGPPNLRPSLIGFVEQVRAKGAVECRRQTHSNRYRCLMATGEDVAEAALLAGVGRAADGATVAYRIAEAQAHQKNTGMWARP